MIDGRSGNVGRRLEVYEIIDFSYFYFKELTLSNVLNLLIFMILNIISLIFMILIKYNKLKIFI